MNYQEKSRKICQKIYFTRRSTEPEGGTEGRPGGPRPTPGTGPLTPRMGEVFQKEFRSAAATRNQDSDPETPFWYPAWMGNLERIIAIVITNAYPSTTDVSLIHE